MSATDSPVDRSTNASSDRPRSSVAQSVCAVMLVLYAIYFARSLVVPMLIAVFAYLTLRPLVRRGKRFGIPSAVGAALIMVSALGMVAIPVVWVIEPARKTLSRTPTYIDNVHRKLGFVFERLDDVNDATTQLSEEPENDENQTEDPVPVEIRQPAWSSNLTLVSGTGNLLSFVTIAVVLLYFLLACGDSLIRSVMSLLPDFSSKRHFFVALDRVQEGLSSYLAYVAVINALLGCSVATAMWALDMPSPMLWGVMACLFNFVPILGAFAGAGIIFIVALLNFDPTWYAFLVMAVFLTLTTIEGQFITPAVLGRSMKMNPAVVFFAIVFWGWMWGLMGVLLSVPILIAIRMTCEETASLLPIARVLGAETQPDDTDKPTRHRDAGLAIVLPGGDST